MYDNLQSLKEYTELGETFAAALRAEAKKFVASDIDRSTRQFTIGALLDAGETEATDKERFWQQASELLRKEAGTWSTFSENTLRRWVRTVRRLDRLPDMDKFRAYLPFEYFAAAAEMVNDEDKRYTCTDAFTPLQWAVQRTIENNPASVASMKYQFLKDEHKPDAWKMFTSNFSQAMKSFDYLPPNLQADIREAVQTIRAAIERLERP